MREIKFRAWIGIAMEYSVGASQYGHFYCYPDAGDTASFMTTRYPESVPLMQFTGLKDRNGKEIYEGDIIVSTENDEVYAIGNMTPLDRHLDMLTDNIGYFTDDKRKKFEKRSPAGRYHLDDWVSWPEMYEVIGDIYQNPELLK